MDVLERHGEEINNDEYLASVLGEVGVEYFKIGSLYAELKSKDLLEEYKYVLERRILELEPTMLNKSVDKYMVNLVHFLTKFQLLFRLISEVKKI